MSPLLHLRIPNGSTDGQKASPEAIHKEISRIAGIQWCGGRKGSIYTGLSNAGGFGCFLYQVEGNRLMAIADSVDLCSMVCPAFQMMVSSGDSNFADTNIDMKQMLEDCPVELEKNIHTTSYTNMYYPPHSFYLF